MNTTLTAPNTSREAGRVAKRKPGRPKGPPRKALFVEIPAVLRDAVDKAALEERRELNTFVVIALEKYLAELGRWPPEKR